MKEFLYKKARKNICEVSLGKNEIPDEMLGEPFVLKNSRSFINAKAGVLLSKIYKRNEKRIPFVKIKLFEN